MTSAKCTVLGTPELFLLILEQMYQRTPLTVAQLACKQWHHLIKNARSIQQTLCFELVKKRPKKARGHGSEERTVNPLLAEVLRHGLQPIRFEYTTAQPQTYVSVKKIPQEGASWRRMLV